jgi:hypothetical protein
MLNLSYTTDQYGFFHINFNKVTRSVLSWREEVKQAAIHIKNSSNKDIVIATSGGIDAEVVCRGFLDAGIPFRMFIVEFENNKNSHDIYYAHKFASDHKIEKIVHKINMERFLTVDMFSYVKQGYRAHLPYRYFQIYLLEQIQKLGCCGIVGSGDMFLLSNNKEFCVSYTTDYFIAVDWCKNNNVLHFPAFHLSTPELTASFLNNPVTKFVTSDYRYVQQKSQQVNFNPEKIIMYHTEFPEMERRKKFHGWEEMMNVWKFSQKKLKLIFSKIESTDVSLEKIRDQLGI